ncbi:MAG TPA: ABC transporter permease [Acidimicrobiales bacterium]|nr:ABC transporter permease [Acidimicrobiales bacterium]
MTDGPRADESTPALLAGVTTSPAAAVLPGTPLMELPGSEGGSSRWHKWRLDAALFASNRMALVSLVFLVALLLFCFVGPFLYRTTQTATTLLNANLAPSGQFPLGTDPEGFNLLGRLMLGGQSTIEVGFAVAVFSTGFGALWGAVAGYVGGIVDAVLMRVVDTALSIPYLFLAVLLATLFSPSLSLIVLTITAVSWPSTARIVRGETLSLRTRDYVTAARGFGGRALGLVGRHVMPNSIGSIVVNFTLRVATAIFIFALLAYLGLGVPPPGTSWGQMLQQGITHLYDNYWWELWLPGVAIVLAVIAVSAVGDGLYDVVVKRQAAGRG